MESQPTRCSALGSGDLGGDCMGRPSQFLQKTIGFVTMVVSSDAWSDWELGEVVFVLTFFFRKRFFT